MQWCADSCTGSRKICSMAWSFGHSWRIVCRTGSMDTRYLDGQRRLEERSIRTFVTETFVHRIVSVRLSEATTATEELNTCMVGARHLLLSRSHCHRSQHREVVWEITTHTKQPRGAEHRAWLRCCWAPRMQSSVRRRVFVLFPTGLRFLQLLQITPLPFIDHRCVAPEIGQSLVNLVLACLFSSISNRSSSSESYDVLHMIVATVRTAREP